MQLQREDVDQHDADEEGGREMPRMEPPITNVLDFRLGESARIYAQWDRDTERQHSGYKNQLQRSRHPLGDQRERVHL